MSHLPDAFLGKPDEYRAWAAEHWKPNPNFCVEHWMPAPVEGKNGLLVSMKLVEHSISEMPDDVRQSPKKMNEWQEAQEQPTCCRLGDERMEELWAEA